MTIDDGDRIRVVKGTYKGKPVAPSLVPVLLTADETREWGRWRPNDMSLLVLPEPKQAATVDDDIATAANVAKVNGTNENLKGFRVSYKK